MNILMVLGLMPQEVGYAKSRPQLFAPDLAGLDKGCGAHLINQGQRPTCIRRKPEPKDRRHVSNDGVAQDAFVQATGRLQGLNPEQSLADLFAGEIALLLRERPRESFPESCPQVL